MVSDEAATSGTAPTAAGTVAADADVVAGAGAGGGVAAGDPVTPPAGARGRGAGGRAAVTAAVDTTGAGAAEAGSFVFSAKVKSKGRSFPSGSNRTFNLTFNGSAAPLIGASSALLIRPSFRGNDSISFSLESSSTTVPENPL